MVLCLGRIQNSDRSSGSDLVRVPDVTLPGSPGIAIYQDHYGGHYRKKIASHVMMLWKYKVLNEDDAL
jgi:hypothetical protein